MSSLDSNKVWLKNNNAIREIRPAFGPTKQQSAIEWKNLPGSDVRHGPLRFAGHDGDVLRSGYHHPLAYDRAPNPTVVDEVLDVAGYKNTAKNREKIAATIREIIQLFTVHVNGTHDKRLRSFFASQRYGRDERWLARWSPVVALSCKVIGHRGTRKRRVFDAFCRLGLIASGGEVARRFGIGGGDYRAGDDQREGHCRLYCWMDREPEPRRPRSFDLFDLAAFADDAFVSKYGGGRVDLNWRHLHELHRDLQQLEIDSSRALYDEYSHWVAKAKNDPDNVARYAQAFMLARAVIRSWEHSDLFAIQCPYDRLHTTLTSSSKRIRRHLLIRGGFSTKLVKPVWYDLRASQPTLLTRLIDCPAFTKAVAGGDLYETIREHIGRDEITRDTTKTQFMSGVLAFHRLGGINGNVPMTENRVRIACRELFPGLIDQIENHNRDNQDRTIQELQRFEAKLILQEIVPLFKRRTRGAWVATVHDSLIVHPEHTEELVNVKTKVMNNNGLAWSKWERGE